MEKINGSKNLDKKLEYKLTHQTNKMSELAGNVVEVEAWLRYTDQKDDEDPKDVVSIMVGGKAYATISEAFIREFDAITDAFGDEALSIEVITKKSKANRDYIICTIA